MADKKNLDNERLNTFYQMVGGEQLKFFTSIFEAANIEREKATEFFMTAAKASDPDALANLSISYFAGLTNRSMAAMNAGRQSVEAVMKAMRSL